MSDHKSLSRSRRFNKRRNNKRKLLFFSILALFFFVILISLIAFGTKENPNEALSTNIDSEENKSSEESADAGPSTSIEADGEESSGIDAINDLDDMELEQVNPTGENVIEAFVADWPPSGTTQEGAHTTSYSDGSQDRIEIKRAVSYVTGIPENDMIEWRVENGGEQKVVATVSDQAKSEYYRIYLDWIDGDGWKPTLSERITTYNP